MDQLICPHCCGEMRFTRHIPVDSPFGPAKAVQNRSQRFCLVVIVEAPVIEQILRHVEAWDALPPMRATPLEDDWPEQGQIPLTYHPVSDIA